MADEKYLGDPMLDRMMKVMMALAQELYETKDRLGVIERLLESRGTLTRADIEAYVPDPSAQREIIAARDAYIERLLLPTIRGSDS
jgi:hypothetical protein